MIYMGSKSRIAKYIIPIMLKDRNPDQVFVDLFCGGCNIVDKIPGARIANDKNKYLIAMWKMLQHGIRFSSIISKPLYDKARIEYRNGTNNEFSDAVIGWIGFVGSFKGRFFDGGYNGNYKARDYQTESSNNIMAQLKNLMDVEFTNRSYERVEIPVNSIIYADPPYKNTKQYDISKGFSHDLFWNWCRIMTRKGHKVFISEYSAPEDFTCIWEMPVKTTMNNESTLVSTEKLFVYELEK